MRFRTIREGGEYKYRGRSLTYFNTLVTVIKRFEKNGKTFNNIRLANKMILEGVADNDLKPLI